MLKKLSTAQIIFKHLVIGLLLSFSALPSVYAQDMVTIDSLHIQLENTEGDSLKILYLSEISYQWSGIYFDSAFKYAKLCYDLALTSGSEYDIGLGLNAMGIVYDYEYQFDSARYYYTAAMENSQKIGDQKRVATSLFNIGVVFYYEGNLDSALHYYLKAEPVFDKLNDRQNLARLYNNMGRIYEKTGNSDFALDVSKKSLEIKEELNDTKGILNTLTNISSIFQSIDAYDSALIYTQTCLDKSKQVGNMVAYKAELVNLGIIYKNLDEIGKAFTAFSEAESLLIESDDNYVKSEVYHNLGEYYFENKDWDKTRLYLDKRKGTLLEEDYLEPAMQHYHLAYLFEKVMGNQSSSLDYLERYMKLREKFLSQQTLKQTTELEQLYQKEKREMEIQRLNTANQLQTLQAEKSDRERNGLIVFGILAIGLLILMTILFQQKKKSLSERETLLREIHHRVKNNLQVISSLLNLQIGSMDDPEAKKAVQAGQHRVRSMALIHQKLYQNEEIHGVDTEDYLNNLVRELMTAFGIDEDNFSYKVDCSQLKLDIDTIIPLGLITNELITNAMKYAYDSSENGILEVSLEEINNELSLKIRDNGKGMDQEQMEKVNSFGWKMIRSLSRKLKADIQVKNENGTLVELTLKRYKLVA